MDGTAIDRLGRRIESLASVEPFDSRSALRRWVAWPLLDALGWSVTDEFVRPDVSIAGESVDYLLSVDAEGPIPAVIVLLDGDASRERFAAMDRLRSVTGIDRGLYVTTTGVVCVRTGTTPERRAVRYESFGEDAEGLDPFRREVVRSRLSELDAAERTNRRLATEARPIREGIVRELSDEVALNPKATRPVVDRVLEEVVESGATNPVEAGPASTDASEADHSVARSRPKANSGPAGNPSEGDPSAGGRPGDDTRSATPPRPDRDTTDHTRAAEETDDSRASTHSGTDPSSMPPSRPPKTDGEGEFVVRVFNERGKIGAVGHATSAGALREATEYFFERGLGGVRLPWETDEGEVILAEQPTAVDGSAWNAYERLSNGTYLNTSGTVADRAARVEALADRASLRVLLTGDWENSF